MSYDQEPTQVRPKAMVLISPFFGGADTYCDFIRGRGVSADLSLKSVGAKWLRAIRKIHFLSPFPFKSAWFGDWKKNCEHFDLVVVHSADLMLPVAKYIRRNKRFGRLVLWYWNPTSRRSDPELAVNKGFEVWSFDPADASKFDIKLNTTYSFRELELVEPVADSIVDCYFLGADKGRAERLQRIAERLADAGLTYEISVVGLSEDQQVGGLRSSAPLSYREMLKRAAGARCLIELTQAGQAGLTLRSLEALFLEKKLVTDNLLILDTPLYDPSRVFVIGHDSWNELADFVRAPISLPSETLKKNYDFEGWLTRISMNNPLN